MISSDTSPGRCFSPECLQRQRDQLQSMYAAYLYRSASKGLAKPPMLAQEIRDRQVEQALAAADEEGST